MQRTTLRNAKKFWILFSIAFAIQAAGVILLVSAFTSLYHIVLRNFGFFLPVGAFSIIVAAAVLGILALRDAFQKEIKGGIAIAITLLLPCILIIGIAALIMYKVSGSVDSDGVHVGFNITDNPSGEQVTGLCQEIITSGGSKKEYDGVSPVGKYFPPPKVPQAINCNNCGSVRLQQDEKFCSHCGTAF